MISLVLPLLMLALEPNTNGTRLKELVSLEGVRDNQLIGYGLVVGLNGTGDHRQTLFPAQSLANLLQQMGVAVDPTAIRVANTAGVMVTATLPPFAQPGMHIDVTAAAIGDATNLQGGLLLLTSLKGIDGQVYAVSQGSVVTGGFATGKTGNGQTVNHPTVGRVPGGATIERVSPIDFSERTREAAAHAAGFHYGDPHQRRHQRKICGRETAAGQAGELGVGRGDDSAGLCQPPD